MSRNINSLATSIEGTNPNQIRIILRLYRLSFSSGLSLKLLNIDLINEYSDLYIVLETLNSDIQYIEGVASNILSDFKSGKVNETLIGMYPTLINQLYKTCLKADKKSLSLLSKCKLIFNQDDVVKKNSYLKSGGSINYNIAQKDIKNEESKIDKEESAPRENEDKEQFIAPYMDIKRVFS
jgi:hypothetical protein